MEKSFIGELGFAYPVLGNNLQNHEPPFAPQSVPLVVKKYGHGEDMWGTGPVRELTPVLCSVYVPGTTAPCLYDSTQSVPTREVGARPPFVNRVLGLGRSLL